MAIAAIADTEAQSTANGVTTSGIDTTGATLLVAVCIYYGGASAPTLSDSKSNSWTGLTARNSAGITVGKIFYVVNPSVGSGHTFTLSGTSSFPAIAVSAWSGVVTTSPFDQENGGTSTSGTSISTGSVTPSENNELLIAGLGCGSSGKPTSTSINGSFTSLGDLANISGTAFGVGHAYLIQSSAAAANPAWSWSGSSNNNVAMIATFKAAAGGGTTFHSKLHSRKLRGKLIGHAA